MRISWKWLSEFVDLSELAGPKALGDLLTQRGLEVEGVESLAQGFDHVVTAEILERNPHPQADRLSLCKVSVGTGEPLEIVCGAQNMKAGDRVALAQIGAHLPNDLKITANKIRGVVSHGMLCSEEELKLKEKSEGILILPPGTPLGQPLAKVLGLDDAVLELKITANRGDCLSHFGIAREVAAALGKKIKKPEVPKLEFEKSSISVFLDAGEAAPQFWGCLIEGVQVGPSPEWLVQRLQALGQRSINAVVDATNLVLLELGQPMHAYDANKILGQKIHVRMGREGETVPLLDGSEVTLGGSELVIADEKRAIGLAGVMGGGNSEVQLDTQSVFLECAEFSPRLVRKAATLHQRKTEAAHRFERGVDPEGLSFAIARLTGLVLQLAGGKVVGSTSVRLPSRTPHAPLREIQFGSDFLGNFLGFDSDQGPLSSKKTEEILKALDCKVELDQKGWTVVPPSYRLDLSIKEDIAEEVARSLGYDQIPATIPPLSSSPVFSHSALPQLTLFDRAKRALVNYGLNETLNFAFTSRAWLSRFDLSSSAVILNPLSEEHEVLVPSLLPGLIRNTLDHWNHHFGSETPSIRLFEVRPVFSAAAPVQAKSQMETGVEEKWKLAFLISGPRYAEGLRSERGEVDFYDLKAISDHLLRELGSRGIRYQSMPPSKTGVASLFHPGKSVEILAGNTAAGWMGLLHPKKSKELKTRSPVWLGELDWNLLSSLSRKAFEPAPFKPWSPFPPMERDFALVVQEDVSAERICQLALKVGKPLAKVAKVFDVYRGPQVAKGMTSIAVRVIFYEEGRSLQESEAEAASARILEAWKKEFKAELRS